MSNPKCKCGQESVWIDNGPRLQYYYCRPCKLEVSPVAAADNTIKLEDPNDIFANVHDYDTYSGMCVKCGANYYNLGVNLTCPGAKSATTANIPPPPTSGRAQTKPYPVPTTAIYVYTCVAVDYHRHVAHLEFQQQGNTGFTPPPPTRVVPIVDLTSIGYGNIQVGTIVTGYNLHMYPYVTNYTGAPPPLWTNSNKVTPMHIQAQLDKEEYRDK